MGVQLNAPTVRWGQQDVVYNVSTETPIKPILEHIALLCPSIQPAPWPFDRCGAGGWTRRMMCGTAARCRTRGLVE